MPAGEFSVSGHSSEHTWTECREYGLAEHEGRHRLRGPGFDPAVGSGSVSHMGGKWPLRLTQVCLALVGQFEDSELELYTAWREAQHHDLTILLCSNTNRQDSSTSFPISEVTVCFSCISMSIVVSLTGLGWGSVWACRSRETW